MLECLFSLTLKSLTLCSTCSTSTLEGHPCLICSWPRLLEEDIGMAVDDQWHSEFVHLAKAISVRDLQEHVSMYYSYVE